MTIWEKPKVHPEEGTFSPQSRIMQNIVPDFRNLSSHPPGTKAPVAQSMAKGAKNTSQKRKAAEDDYSFFFVDARFGGAGDA